MIRNALVLLFLSTTDSTLHATEHNVILFITDDESPTLGCYGDQVAVTPNIDAIAKDGVVFERAYATTASCSASRSVVMSGLHNHLNGQYGHRHNFHKFASYHNVISLALPRVMARAGYRSAIVGKCHVAPEEVYHFDTVINGNTRNAVQMAHHCKAFIASQDERPFFLYFSPADPHRGGGTDQNSRLDLKPNLFGNQPNRCAHDNVEEVYYDAKDMPVPSFLPDTPETREELSQYYQSVSRIDQGLGQLVTILREAGQYDKTMIVFTSDHGMAFPGGKTTVYEPGLRVPFVVRNPYAKKRGFRTQAMISHIDITPTLLDFAGGLDKEKNAPMNMLDANAYWTERGENLKENRGQSEQLDRYHGRSWLHTLESPNAEHWDMIFASHSFHEIQMYYPMRVVRDSKFKLIWNIAYPLSYPFASDLWVASSWQAQFNKGPNAPYGHKTVGQYMQRPQFELYDMTSDPCEIKNLADYSEFSDILDKYKTLLRSKQKVVDDPWITKWEYE